jgi:hypothetical protein
MCHRARLVSTEDKPPSPSRAESPAAPEKVIIDPSKGGAVSPKTSQQSRALEVEQGHWVWDGLVKILEIDLFSPAWEVRHGAAMALRELLKAQGKYGGTKGLIPLLTVYVLRLTVSQSALHVPKMMTITNDGATGLLRSFSVSSFLIGLGTSSRIRWLRLCARLFPRHSLRYFYTCLPAQCCMCIQFCCR